MSRGMATLSGVLVLALLAAGLSEATLAVGHRGSISDDTLDRPAASHSVSTPTPSPTSFQVQPPVASDSPSPSEPASSGSYTTTNAFVHMRASESTSSAILFNLNGNTQVELLSGGNTQWQEVEYNGAVGYVYKTYLNN
jgi:uncharacterized protein YgiM (DUF1202 family)